MGWGVWRLSHLLNIHTLKNSVRMLNTCSYFIGPINDTDASVIVCSSDFPNCVENKTIEFEKCDNGQYIFKLKSLDYCGAYCIGKSIRSLRIRLHYAWRVQLFSCICLILFFFATLPGSYNGVKGITPTFIWMPG